MLDALRRAAGAPVSYAELREAGVELPASVVSELELAGVTIERCFGEERGAVGVRLDPANDPAARPTPDPAERPIPTETEAERVWGGVQIDRASSFEGLVLSVLGWLSLPAGKGIRMERHRRTLRGRASRARPAMAAGTNEDWVREKRFGVNSRRRVLVVATLVAGIALVSSFVAIRAPGGDRRNPQCRSRSGRIRGWWSRPAARARRAHAGPHLRRPACRCRLPSRRSSRRRGIACWRPVETPTR